MPALSGSGLALMQARSGLARSGATRSDYYYGSLALTIGGVDHSGDIDKYSTEIEDVLNAEPDTASFVTNGIRPTVGQEVVIGSGAINNRIFGGHIVGLEQLSIPAAAHERWVVSCTDYTWLLNRRLVTKAYAAQAAHLIVLDIIANYGAGFTTANVNTSSPTVEAMEFKAERLGDAISRVATLASAGGTAWNWYPDYTRDVHFFSSEVSQAPADLTTSNLSYSQLKWSPQLDQVRTRVYVEGGGGVTTAPVAVGATSIPVDECAWYSATGGSLVSGANLLTHTGRSTSSGPGTLTGVPASGTGSIATAIKQGDDVNVWVQRDDAAAQATLAALEGGDGIHEAYIQDRRLSIASAAARGDAELTLFSTAQNTGTYQSLDKFTRSGKTVNVTLPARGISTTAIVLQRVKRKYIAHERWSFQVTFSRVRRDFNAVLLYVKHGGQS